MSFEVLFDIPVRKDEPSGPYSHQKPGKGMRSCVSCYRFRGIIRKLMMCRRCFREYATDIGFRIYD